MAMRVIMTQRDLDEGCKVLFRMLGDGIWDRFPEITKIRTRDKVVRICQAMKIDIVVDERADMTPTEVPE